ncbi:hypothetical protein [Vulcanisaeta distributa]|uniref:Uncharacterized protein n=1 Tax=Vulcanisaeta distributa (strain DSM 14429 / JCM 11212 / NBRC 100878 / IC-017) TaxID=572478 RepID=E1QQV3_VULDI|nr:hypothetical protein [Vulcanisaeta distributa]ADN50523.1 hypothetical protein Vdis_1135 [Vulcanisaeta distributa DSM 14429]
MGSRIKWLLVVLVVAVVVLFLVFAFRVVSRLGVRSLVRWVRQALVP